MTKLFPAVSLTVLNQLLFIVIFNLIPLLIWVVWDLDQRRRSWLSRRQARNSARRGLSKTLPRPRTSPAENGPASSIRTMQGPDKLIS
jgi:hypothetical protein